MNEAKAKVDAEDSFIIIFVQYIPNPFINDWYIFWFKEKTDHELKHKLGTMMVGSINYQK